MPPIRAFERGGYSLDKSERFYVHLHANFCAPSYGLVPVADDVPDVELAFGLDEQALAVAAARHEKGDGGGHGRWRR